MDIYNGFSNMPIEPAVVILGDFDGVHMGHRQLIYKAKILADKLDCKVAVYTFTVNSKLCLGADNFSLITTDSEKNVIFERLGVDTVCYDDFFAIKDFTPEEFCDYLTENTKVKAVVCGENYTFGKFAAADSSKLKHLMNQKSVECVVVPSFSVNGIPVSSTSIRKLISAGDTDAVSHMLGYRYFVEAEVVHGAALGRKLGFPTINQLSYGGKTVPMFGVYCCICHIDGERYMGVVNVGVKPTVTGSVDNPPVVYETNILDYSGNLYGKKIRIEFYKMLRSEKKFSSLDELKENVLHNIEQTREYFGKENGI